MPNGNTNPGLRTALEVTIIVLQLVLVAVGAEIRFTLKNHDERIQLLEREASLGGRWTREDQRGFETGLNQTLYEIKLDVGKIKNRLDVN